MVCHQQLEGNNRNLMRPDGVHLNFIDLDIFCQYSGWCGASPVLSERGARHGLLHGCVGYGGVKLRATCLLDEMPAGKLWPNSNSYFTALVTGCG